MLKIFRPGTFKDAGGVVRTFTAEQLQQCAASYDPAKRVAPICIGHPASDSPAYGRVEKLDFVDGFLRAFPGQLVPKFAEFAEAAYTGLSAAFYKPDSPYNPTPGAYYLRHIGLTNTPALSNLGPLEFAALESAELAFAEGDRADEAIEFAVSGLEVQRLFRGLREWVIEQGGLDVADRVLPSWAIDMLAEPVPAPVEGFVAASPAVVAQSEDSSSVSYSTGVSAELAQREQQLNERARHLDRREFEAFCQTLLETGKQFNKVQAVEIFMGLDDAAELTFSEGGVAVQKPLKTAFKEFLAGLTEVVEFAEISGGSIIPESTTDPVEIARRIARYQEQVACSFSEAAAYVQTHPEYVA